MKILIVEDDEGLREGLTELVSELGEAQGVSTAAEGLALLEREDFDLVLTDLIFEGSTLGGGNMICEAHERLIPVALITGSVEPESSDLRPDARVTKPFSLEEVLSLVERFKSLQERVSRTPASEARSVPVGKKCGLPARSGGLRLLEGELRCGNESVLPERYIFVSAAGVARLEVIKPSRFVWHPLEGGA